jgi:hypothetical protein
MHDPIRLYITKAQLTRARAGHQIQIKHEHIGHSQGLMFQHLHPETHRKIVKAYHARKGVRMHLTDQELEGTGAREFFQKVGRWFKKNEHFIKPIVSTALDIGAQAVPKFAPARAVVKQVTGYGISGRPTRFVGQPIEGYGEMEYAQPKPKRLPRPKRRTGRGIIPAGYSGF